MMEPQLKFLEVPGVRAKFSPQRRIAWWEWNATGQEQPDQVVLCVHGLSRQARDFDVLAQALAPHARVLCVDMAGRGQSDWLAEPMDYQVPTYVADMAELLRQLRLDFQQTTGRDSAELRLDWVGTSMGGLIGMALAAPPHQALRRLVLNDVGPEIQLASLRRIETYLGNLPVFPSEIAAVHVLEKICAAFGPHSPEQWLALSRPMLRRSLGGWTLHYDPGIAAPFRQMLAAMEALHHGGGGAAAESPLWQLYDQIQACCLLLRGAESDLLTPETAAAMANRGPRARCVEFAGVGHAPALVQPDQVAVVKEFLLSP
ncbi:alpha/beta fold hydrolase [Malikia spinosa]|uniref:alpha/beta fold hydrolase n=1 Tax=Malikia spinosa TaxID=86180 RepID=UPI003FA304B5